MINAWCPTDPPGVFSGLPGSPGQLCLSTALSQEEAEVWREAQEMSVLASVSSTWLSDPSSWKEQCERPVVWHSRLKWAGVCLKGSGAFCALYHHLVVGLLVKLTFPSAYHLRA